MNYLEYLFGKKSCVAMDESEGWKSNPLVVKIKDYFGCSDDYFPTKTYEQIVDSLEGETTLDVTNPGMSSDTAAREIQIAAVILLVKTGDQEAVKLANEFGEFLMTPDNTTPKGVKKGEKDGRHKKCIEYMAESALMFNKIINRQESAKQAQ